MNRFIPYEKLSKKRQREIDREKRGSWRGLNPVTRTPPNPNAYRRKKTRTWTEDDSAMNGSFCLFYPSTVLT